MERRYRRRLFGFFFLLVVLVSIETTSTGRRLAGPLVRAVAPLEGALYRLTRAGQQRLTPLLLGDVTYELATLRSQLQSLIVDQSALKTLEQENASLRALLDLREQRRGLLLAARVIGQDPADPAAVLRLDRGARDGVVSGAAVLNEQGSLAGIIADVGESNSTVRLLRHRATKLPVRVTGKDSVFGLLTSLDGLSLKLDQVPKDAPLAIGDVVVTSLGLDGVPPALVVGTIFEVSTTPEALWQMATVTPAVEPRALDLVGVVAEQR